MRGRHTAALLHGLVGAMRVRIAHNQRRLLASGRRLDAFEAGRRLAAVRTRLVAANGRLKAALLRAHSQADARLREAAGRLDTMSPLAVLARGYAVCWADGGTRIVRAATDVGIGDPVQVTLARGTLECDVTGRRPAAVRTTGEVAGGGREERE